VSTYDTPHPVFQFSDTEADQERPVYSDATPKLLRSGLLGRGTLLEERDG
jgi:hypothetical protein